MSFKTSDISTAVALIISGALHSAGSDEKLDEILNAIRKECDDWSGFVEDVNSYPFEPNYPLTD